LAITELDISFPSIERARRQRKKAAKILVETVPVPGLLAPGASLKAVAGCLVFGAWLR
jgi:hypothetical protein